MYKYFRFEMAALSTAWTRTLELVWGNWQKAPYYIAAAAFTSFALFLRGGVPVVTDYILVLAAAFLGAVMLFSTVFAWQLVTAPYKIWKGQQNEIESLNEVLNPKKTRVEIDVGNGDEFVQIRGTYMFKVTNNGEDSSTCLARLVRYTQDENEYVVNEVLPTKRQREEGRSGRFNLSKGESKYIMLIGSFPDGWYFLLESGIRGPLQLDSPITAEVTILGCGDKASTTIIIDLLDEQTRLLRLTKDE